MSTEPTNAPESEDPPFVTRVSRAWLKFQVDRDEEPTVSLRPPRAGDEHTQCSCPRHS